MSVSAVLKSPRAEVSISLASAGGWKAVGEYAPGGSLLRELCESGSVPNTQDLAKELGRVDTAPANVRHTLLLLAQELDGGADDESIAVVD